MPGKKHAVPAKRQAKTRPAGAPPRAPISTGQADELLDAGKAIALLKTTRPTFYRWLRTGQIRGMKVGRQWRFYAGDIRRFLKGQQPKVELPVDIGPLIRTLTARLSQLGRQDPSPPEAEPLQRLATLVVMVGLRLQASDIHLEPYEDGVHLRYRVDGVLHPVTTFDLRLLPAVIEQFKRLAACDVREQVLPQDGRVLMEMDGAMRDLRLCFVPSVKGESLTIRLFPHERTSLALENLGYGQRELERLQRALAAPWGLIALVGPTDSGTRTSLYACLSRLVGPDRKVMTVEDPVACPLDGAVQMQINAKIGLTYERALSVAMRSAPNVVMIGELTTRPALLGALQCAMTGHLVLTRLHTDDAVGALRRLADMSADPAAVGEATKLIVAQRLARRLCPACSVPAAPAPGALARAEKLARSGGMVWESLAKDFRRPVGCPQCGQTGFRGKTLIAEALEMTRPAYAALVRGADAGELRLLAVREGMTTMAADAVRRAASGQTSIDEALRVLPPM